MRTIGIGALAALAACAPTRGTVTIINRSSEILDRVDVRIGSKSFRAEDVLLGDHAVFTFEPYGDSSYHVTVTFESGRQLADRIGYVTDGYPSRDEIYVLDDRLALEPGFASGDDPAQPPVSRGSSDASGGGSW